MRSPRALLIAGPTASGKSALAIALAEELGGSIVNADSMQVYGELRVLTARPAPEEEARVPHRLYGHVPAAVAYSVARWLEDAAAVVRSTEAEGRLPIIVGGTGLYFAALLEGLSPVPAIPQAVREHWRREAERVQPVQLHAMLAARDPAMAARLMPLDRQRVTRALEVIEATGTSLAEWQTRSGTPLLAGAETLRLLIAPERDLLRERCAGRFGQMLATGALVEVEALLQMQLENELPAMRAVGVRPLARHIRGTISLGQATEEAIAETRQLAKRQMTWARQRMGDWHWLAGPDLAAALRLLTGFEGHSGVVT